MNFLLLFLISAVITGLSLIVVSKLPTGVEVDGADKAIIAGIVFGILNGIVSVLPSWLGATVAILTLGIVPLLLNLIIFGLAAKLVEGFRLRWGFWSALLGAIALAIVNSVVSWAVGLIVPGL